MKTSTLLKAVTLCVTLSFSHAGRAQTWPYVVAAGTGVNTGGGNGVSGRDLCVVSDQEIYTAMHATTNDQIEVYKYNGIAWSVIPSPNPSGQTIGMIVLKKSAVNNDVYIAYSYFSGSGYSVTVKKYDGTSWSQLGTNLPLAAGSSIFGFQLDNTDRPIVLGSKTSSLNDNRISRLESGTWVHYTIPNSVGSTFTDNTSYIDNTNNLVFAWYKTVSINSCPANIDTLAGNSLFTTPENINMMFSGNIYFVRDGAGTQTIYNFKTPAANKIALKSFKKIAGTWSNTATDTLDWTTLNCVEMANNGNTLMGTLTPNTPNLSKMFMTGNYMNPVFQPTVGTPIYKIRFSTNTAYALLNNGVVKQDLSMITSVKQNSFRQSDISVYPNPASQNIRIQGVDVSEGVRVKIISVDGKIVKEEIADASGIIVSDLNAGLYFIELTYKNGITGVSRFIKE